MLAIILSACLIADPKQCRDFRIQVDFQMPAKYCPSAAGCRAVGRRASAVADRAVAVPAVDGERFVSPA